MVAVEVWQFFGMLVLFAGILIASYWFVTMPYRPSGDESLANPKDPHENRYESARSERPERDRPRTTR
jgi:hypothetical protein